METWGRLLQDATTNGRLETTNQKISTKLWQAWVAWIQRARQILGTETLQAKDHSNTSLIHNSNIDPDDVWAGLWLPTQFSTLATLWFPNGLNVSAKRNSGHGFLKQTCRTNLFATVRHIWQTCAAERLAVPKKSKKSNQNFTVTGMSCLDRART